MNDSTTNDPHSDAIVATRPDWMSDEKWAQIKSNTTTHIERLLEELHDEAAGQPTRSLATYTWRDLAARDVHLDRLRLAESDRDQLPLGGQDLRDDFRTYPEYGGLLVWNRTRDDETGLLVMITGQTPTQERQVMENAGWLVSCGAVYAAAGRGMRGWKTSYDDLVTVEGDEHLVWILSNDADIASGTR